MKELQIDILASGAHCHLSEQDFHSLFGPDAELICVRMLGEGKDSQFMTDKKVEISCEKGSRMLSIIGPFRAETQIEVSFTEGRALGIRPIIADSGNLKGTLGCILKGPTGTVKLQRGVMVARRHIHLNVDEANLMEIKDHDFVMVRIEGPRALVFDKVLVRLCEGETVLHVDFDEMNAAGLYGKSKGWLYKTPQI